MVSPRKPIVLHIGDPIQYNPDIYERFESQFTVVRPSTEERQRDAFLQALRERKWGDFDAVFRPFWNTGGEMGRWDAEMIPLLPKSLKVFASAGAGYDWADVDLLGKAGWSYPFNLFAKVSALMLGSRRVVLQWSFSILRGCCGHGSLPRPVRL